MLGARLNIGLICTAIHLGQSSVRCNVHILIVLNVATRVNGSSFTTVLLRFVVKERCCV